MQSFKLKIKRYEGQRRKNHVYTTETDSAPLLIDGVSLDKVECSPLGFMIAKDGSARMCVENTRGLAVFL